MTTTTLREYFRPRLWHVYLAFEACLVSESNGPLNRLGETAGFFGPRGGRVSGARHEALCLFFFNFHVEAFYNV